MSGIWEINQLFFRCTQWKLAYSASDISCTQYGNGDCEWAHQYSCRSEDESHAQAATPSWRSIWCPQKSFSSRMYFKLQSDCSFSSSLQRIPTQIGMSFFVHSMSILSSLRQEVINKIRHPVTKRERRSRYETKLLYYSTYWYDDWWYQLRLSDCQINWSEYIIFYGSTTLLKM
jgi:hypothetical protein